MPRRLPQSAREDEADLLAQLRGAGLRVTQPRLAVLRALRECGGHPSADELAVRLEQQDIVLPRATVYNVLADLARHGLVDIAESGPGRTLYESTRERHDHFICRLCGTILDVEACHASHVRRFKLLPGARVEQTSVVYRGICPRCNVKRPC